MLKSLRGVRSVLKMGKNQPKGVPFDVIMALTRIEVTDNAVERDTFQMSFTAGKNRPKDYGILSTGLFEPYTRVGISLTIGAKVEPLMSGVITHFQLKPSNDAGMSSFTVTGEGIDVMLGLKQRNAKYDQQSDTTSVQGLVDKYARHGLNLDVASEAQGLEQPDDNHIIPRQYATDLAHIQQFAPRNGYVFSPDPLPIAIVRLYCGPETREL